MKKFICFIFICSLSLGFVGCGDDDDDNKKEEEETFSWNGDWNDSNDPNYFGGYYNPIEGDWQFVNTPDVRLVYTKDFTIEQVSINDKTGEWESVLWEDEYTINDIGLRYMYQNSYTYNEYKIVKENNEEYLMKRTATPQLEGKWRFDEWKKLKRYKE